MLQVKSSSRRNRRYLRRRRIKHTIPEPKDQRTVTAAAVGFWLRR
ncbi:MULTISPECIES: hypothetical protein [Streptomyces]|nr:MULTISPECIES: hypothetical protein [Streptomyces]